MKIVMMVFLNIGDERQSVYNGNPTKATVMRLLRVEVLKMVTTNGDDDIVIVMQMWWCEL